MSCDFITINGRQIGMGFPSYIIAEMSANHNLRFEDAVRIVQAAKDAGADAIKLQTYTPDTITINCDSPLFHHGKGSLWEGKNLYQLYSEAYTPWEWQPKLKALADSLGMHCFSTPFDATAVDFLERMEVPAHKIASFELVDTALLRRVARTGKPIIMSTGMATLEEIEEAVATLRAAGCEELALLKCTSTYPAMPEEMNLRTIPDLSQRFGVPVGLSDHTLGIAVPVAAVALGACIVEKHFTLSRTAPGPDSEFSLEPHEFKSMVQVVREAERSLGTISYQVSEHERASRVFRRSLFVVADMKAGEPFTERNIRSIRPGHGLAPKHLGAILGRRATRDTARGAPLTWDLIGS
jgi:N-acetylneuraminate synthase